ncbi:hypothetical protein ACS15_3497 [Ralstonia insidiosa]|uniref:Uncharacterized protein n=1 Tax=Ralstonia insidiosa TaxID=190721 RepID=A0AAC9BI61_9RALS|nr:hypothetical protein ACS15_3497 [Ralstonia insidiosa]
MRQAHVQGGRQTAPLLRVLMRATGITGNAPGLRKTRDAERCG